MGNRQSKKQPSQPPSTRPNAPGEAVKLMKAIELSSEFRLALRNIPVPTPQRGEVLVRMRLTPINTIDLLSLRGIDRERHTYPFIPGYEGVGEVVSCGPKVSNRKKLLTNQVALYSPNGGTWAEYCCVPEWCCFPLPRDINPEQAASPFVDPMTAHTFLTYAQKQGHKSVVLTGAFTPLGKQILRLAPSFRIKACW
ncbi:putative zinc-binding dehydrogenase [Paratrimastix pyriformis]|uniref:Zinc-binding dehydrogenase n=1 Tax=Paratrimastix pyriformis TaxID=342808 RepID=A0ABQ8ULB8_9EUKA|nr:putative zinc-binding dehydrogenase [Paratrimastix pyriformis]